MGRRVDNVSDKIISFRRKYYVNLFLRGTILSLTLLMAYYLMVALLEYNLWLGKEVRLTLFIMFFVAAIYCLYRYLRDPLLWWLSGRNREGGKCPDHRRSLPGNPGPTP